MPLYHIYTESGEILLYNYNTSLIQLSSHDNENITDKDNENFILEIAEHKKNFFFSLSLDNAKLI